MTRTCFAALSVAAVLAIGNGPALADDVAETVARGRGLIEANCARCHAIGKEGASPLDLAPPFREVVLRYPLPSLAEALAEGIVTGHPDMPEFTFEPREIEAILAYLDTLKPQPGK